MALKFVCDEMLQGLGRWLRAAGYDTLIATDGQPDRELLALARSEGRYLLSRDRLLLEHKASDGVVVLLFANDLPGCAQELSGLLEIDWLHAPFSRCLLCNQPLAAVTEAEVPLLHKQLPEDVREAQGELLFCPACNKLYWNGGHVRRMRARLQAFARGEWH